MYPLSPSTVTLVLFKALRIVPKVGPVSEWNWIFFVDDEGTKTLMYHSRAPPLA